MKVVENGFYVNFGEYTIRHVERLINKTVYWFSYDLKEGYPLSSGICQIKRLQQWARREATKEEIFGLQLRDPVMRGSSISDIILFMSKNYQ